MSGKTKIEWTDDTWNPIVGCSVVSPGCTNCYAMRFAGNRLDINKRTPHYADTTMRTKAGPVWTGHLARASDNTLTAPLRWRKPRRIFVNSMSDLFHEDAPDVWIDRVFAVMALAPHHSFQILTKRAKRMRDYLSRPAGSFEPMQSVIEAARLIRPDDLYNMTAWPLPNCWLGVSVEDQQRADERIPDLLATPAAVRFVSYEPALGPVDFDAMPFEDGDPQHKWSALTGQAIVYATGVNGHPDFTARLDMPIRNHLDWIICGGESGPNARPMHPDWARSVRNQCADAGVAFFMKQLSGPGGRAVKDMAAFPDDLRIREMPEARQP